MNTRPQSRLLRANEKHGLSARIIIQVEKEDNKKRGVRCRFNRIALQVVRHAIATLGPAVREYLVRYCYIDETAIYVSKKLLQLMVRKHQLTLDYPKRPRGESGTARFSFECASSISYFAYSPKWWMAFGTFTATAPPSRHISPIHKLETQFPPADVRIKVASAFLLFSSTPFP